MIRRKLRRMTLFVCVASICGAAPGEAETPAPRVDALQKWKKEHQDESNPLQTSLAELRGKRDVCPSGKYAVEFVQQEAGGFAYRVVTTASHQVLATLKSTYRNEGNDPTTYEGALRDAEDAVVFWSKDSRFVAIEESNDRYRGTVLVASLENAPMSKK